jgi:exopolysaccharide production protein ExoQ
MSTYTPTIRFEQTRQRTALLPSIVATSLSFWLPLAVIGVALYGVEHSSYHSNVSNQAGDDNSDLARDIGNSSLLRQVSIAAIGLLGGLLLLTHSVVPLELNRRSLFLIALLCAWLLLSALWAEDSSQSLKRSMMPLLMIIGVLGVAKHWRPREICLFTVILTAGFLLLGVVAEIANGSFLQGIGYRFSGTLHPNNQGVNCAALCLASLSLYFDSRSQTTGLRRLAWLMLFFVGAAFLLLTQSRTSAIAVGVALLVLFALHASRTTKWLAAAALAPIIALAIVFLLESDRGADLAMSAVQMGRAQDANDVSSLTGRIPIWTEVLGDISRRPLTGYGYGGFWTSEQVMRYTRVLNWEFNHAHSVYFESLLNVGAIGLALGLLIVLSSLWSAARSYTNTRDTDYFFIVGVLTLALVHGLLDSNFVTVGFAPLLAMLCIAAVVLHGESTVGAPVPVSTGEIGSAANDRQNAFKNSRRTEPS